MLALKKIRVSACWIITTSLLLASAAKADTVKTNTMDPYENYNRHAFALNSKLDQIIFKPIATAYKTVLPKPVTKGVANFFSNLGEIPTAVNDILQGNFYLLASDFWRFTINSTVGVLGIFDVATHLGLEKHNQDLGLTFADWGYKSSTYIVLPIFGPSTIRDAIAMPINQGFFTVYPYTYPVTLRNSAYGLNMVNQRAQLLNYDKLIKQMAFDRYEFERNAYMQRRQAQIDNNSKKVEPAVEGGNLLGD